MKNKILVVFFALIISIPLFGQARSRLSKIGFVDSDKIYESVIKDASLLSIIDKTLAKSQAKIVEIADDILTLQESLADVSLIENQRTKIEKSIASKQLQYNKLQARFNSSSDKREDVLRVEINTHIARSIYVITRREGYTAIIEKNQSILFVDKDFDITNTVLAYVRESIKKIG